MHGPWQTPSQQTPSTQLVLAHCPLLMQGSPFGCLGWQVLSEILQKYSAEHWVSSAQFAAHAVPVHLFGAQGVVEASMQLPAPLHACPV